MPSTYLTLTNKLLDRFNEVNLTSDDFTSARGVHKAAQNNINAALSRLNSHEYTWPFNEAEGTQVLTVGQVLYDFPANFKQPDMRSFYIQKDDALNVKTRTLREITKEEWYENMRDRDFDNSTSGLGIPDFIFYDSNEKFGVTQATDKAYTIKYKYYVKFTPLLLATDETTVPEQWDETIIDLAEPYMWRFMTNAEQQDRSEARAKQALTDMRNILINDDFKVYVNMNVRQYTGAHYYNN